MMLAENASWSCARTYGIKQLSCRSETGSTRYKRSCRKQLWGNRTGRGLERLELNQRRCLILKCRVDLCRCPCSIGGCGRKLVQDYGVMVMQATLIRSARCHFSPMSGSPVSVCVRKWNTISRRIPRPSKCVKIQESQK